MRDCMPGMDGVVNGLTINMDTISLPDAIRLVEFGAAWCGPCRAFEPVLRSFGERHPAVPIDHVDVDAHPELAAAYDIRSMPTTVVFRDGTPVGRIIGAQPLQAFEAAVRDMLGRVVAA